LKQIREVHVKWLMVFLIGLLCAIPLSLMATYEPVAGSLSRTIHDVPATVASEGSRGKLLLINLARTQLLVNLVRTEGAWTVVVSLSESH
jgi:hypothetical protein